MGLTLITFIAAALLLVLVPFSLARGRGSSATLFVALANLFLAFFALFHGLVDILSGLGESPLGLLFSRLSAASLGCAFLTLIIVSLSFPSWLSWPGKIGAALLGLAIPPLCLLIVGTDSYMSLIFGSEEGIVRFVGPYYNLISDGMAGLAILAGFVHLLRGFTSRDRIQIQRSIIAAIALLLGIFGIWFVGRALLSRPNIAAPVHVAWSFYLLPLPALVIGLVTSYALSVSRVFEWRIVVKRILSYLLLLLLFGVPLGLVVAFLLVMGRLSFWIPLVGSPLAFLLALRMANSFASQRLERILTHEYREELESGLSHIDLAMGRDAVLAEAHRLLAAALDLVHFAVLIEDERGVYKTIYSSTGKAANIERGSKIHEAIESSGATVLLRSEAIANPDFAEIKDQLLGFLDTFRGEALIFAREGRRIIGAFVIGARRSGGDYTDYDYESFKSIYGKLFVIAYYLKNVARESIVYTVSRELALSDQVVRFALEKVDRVDDPDIDTAWTMRSTRSLGGDFVDFVRVSKRRWFFVLGDISGKGLSASMNMLILKSMIRTFLRIEKDFSGLVQRVNAFIKENLPRGTFFAGVFGYFDFEKKALYFINCGIPALLLYSPSFDAFIEVQGEGKILGFVRDVGPYIKPRKILLPPGSMLVAATDGVVESENLRGDRFGKERFIRAVQDRRLAASQEIADGVVDDLLEFTGRKQEDDITLLVMKFLERSET